MNYDCTKKLTRKIPYASSILSSVLQHQINLHLLNSGFSKVKIHHTLDIQFTHLIGHGRNVPARGLAREDSTATPGIKVFSSSSNPRRSKSSPAPNAYLLSSDSTSSLTAEQSHNNLKTISSIATREHVDHTSKHTKQHQFFDGINGSANLPILH